MNLAFGSRGIPARVRNIMIMKLWNEITNPFLNFNRWSLGKDQLFDPTLYDEFNYLCMLGLNLFHVSKRGV